MEGALSGQRDHLYVLSLLAKAVGYSGSVDSNCESFQHKGMVVD